MCLWVINKFVCTYVDMYTDFMHLSCHKQVHICTFANVNIIIYSTAHTYKPTFNDKHVSYKLMIFERKIDVKNAKKSRKVALRWVRGVFWDVGCAHPEFGLHLACIRCPKVRCV